MAFEADERQTVTCCRFATAEEIEEDPESYDCATCRWREVQERLDEHDRLAMRVYRAVSLPVVRDLRLAGLVFDVLGLELTLTEARLLLDKLDLIHREVMQTADDQQTDGVIGRD